MSTERFETIREEIAAIDPEIVLFDGFEEALLGHMQRFTKGGHVTVALYDYDACLQVLVSRDGMSFEDAVDFFEFNTVGCYAGPLTPAFAHLYSKELEQQRDEALEEVAHLKRLLVRAQGAVRMGG
jgi:hypothetical protein